MEFPALLTVLGGPNWAGWTQLGMALLGILGATFAAAMLCDDSYTSGSGAEQMQPGVVGLQLPFSVLLRRDARLAAHRAAGHDPVV